jgi:acetylxylan esterase
MPLTHNGGGDPQGLVSVVKYALDKYNGDAPKVSACGSSSRAMMTNVLPATYPDVFSAGASFPVVPAGCWAGVLEVFQFYVNVTH